MMYLYDSIIPYHHKKSNEQQAKSFWLPCSFVCFADFFGILCAFWMKDNPNRPFSSGLLRLLCLLVWFILLTWTDFLSNLGNPACLALPTHAGNLSNLSPSGFLMLSWLLWLLCLSGWLILSAWLRLFGNLCKIKVSPSDESVFQWQAVCIAAQTMLSNKRQPDSPVFIRFTQITLFTRMIHTINVNRFSQ